MIADACFGRAAGRLRPLRFVPRAALPLAAACRVAEGVREALRELLGAGCELVMGEPAALGAEAWSLLSGEAFLFLARGRPSDAVLVLPRRDARRLVRHAFGESDGPGAPPDGVPSALELRALERIAARCAVALEPLGGERGANARPLRAHEAPACVAYVDLRVGAPLALELGIALVRPLPAPAPQGALPAGALGDVALEARVEIGVGTLDAGAFVQLRPGDVVRLDSQVGAPACLKIAGQRLATGIAGVVASRTAFLVHDVATGAPR